MENPKILIVDDEEKNIKILKALLASENYHLFSVLSGKEALQKIIEDIPDLILLDVMMPEMDGFEVCKRIKTDPKTKVIPVIIVTALSEKQHRIKAMEVWADDFISKPVDRIELQIRVKSLLRIKSYHDELMESYNEIADKNQKLMELEKIKDGLTHMVIHDLRNPLTAIYSNIQLIQLENPDLPESQKETVQDCLRFCQELHEMIQNLLDVNKMEEGKLIPHKEEVNLGSFLQELVDQFAARAHEKEVSVSLSQNGDNASLLLDRRLMKRVVANLLDNSLRYTPPAGKVEVIVDSLREKGALFLSVKDSGLGLAPEYHQKVFDKFGQVKMNQAGVISGSCGLGLTFCKMAVEAHGGKIWVESEGQGKGCTFTALIPISN